MISKDKNLLLCALEIVSSLFERSHNSQQLLVMDLVVAFRRNHLAREVSDRMSVIVVVLLA